MRRWLLLAALALFFTGCQSITHPPQPKKDPAEFRSAVPNGETAPFAS
jgi:hypothetical protein